MARYRKILVAFDGSDSARNALDQAILMARAGRSWIKLLAVVPKYEGDVELATIDDIGEVLRGPVEAMLREAEARVEEAGVPVLTNIEQGSAIEGIASVSRDERCDLIVMGRKGRHRIEKMLMGGVTAQVVAESSLDVLIVPLGASLGFDTLAYALDAASSPSAMRRAVEFARSSGSSLHAVFVVDMYPEFYAEAPAIVERLEARGGDTLQAFRRVAGEHGVEAVTHLLRGEPHLELVRLASEINAGAILLCRDDKTSFMKHLSGDTIGRIIGYSECPVFVIPEQDQE